MVVAKLYGLYDFDEERTDHSTADDLVGVLHLVTVGSWLFFAFAAVTQRADPGFARLLGFWLFAIAAITVGRAIARGVARRHLAYVQNTIIVGAGDVGQLVAKKLRQHPEYGLNLVGFVDDQPKERISSLSDIALLGGLGQLPQMVQILDVERVIVAFSNDSHEEMLDLIRDLKDLDIQIDLVPRFFEVIGTNVGIHTAEGLPLIGLPALRLSRSSHDDQADDGPGALDHGAGAPRAALRSPSPCGSSSTPAGPSSSASCGWAPATRPSRSSSSARWTLDADARKHEFAALNKHNGNGGDPRMFKIPNDPRVTRSGSCCAASPSTSCRSSSTSSVAR